MVPDPMISTPFSAWIFRIENVRSCLRIVDAPSTPISSDIATRSAGVFFFSSFKCISCSFLGELCSSVLRWSQSRRAAGRRDAEGQRPAIQENWPEPSRFEVCLAGAGVNQQSKAKSAKRSERADDYEHDNQCRGNARDLIDHAHGLARHRSFT